MSVYKKSDHVKPLYNQQRVEALERQVKVLSTFLLAVVSNDSPIQGAELEIQLHAAAHHDVAQVAPIPERRFLGLGGPLDSLRDIATYLRSGDSYFSGKDIAIRIDYQLDKVDKERSALSQHWHG